MPIKMTATPMVNKVQIQLPQTPVSKEAIKKPAKVKTGGGGKKSSCGSGVVIKQCEICGTQFRSAKSYKRHMDQCHVANGPRHVCCLCQRASYLAKRKQLFYSFQSYRTGRCDV